MRWLLWLSLAVGAQTLPEGAVVVERRAIPVAVRPNRELVLWVLKPTKFNRGPNTSSNPYVCPERTRGHHYTGPTRISLVDTRASAIINTISIHPYEQDTFDLPFLIRADQGLYRVLGVAPEAEGKPALLDLRDINGDGLALEALFFEAQACMGLLTASVGYSPRQDRVIQYEIELMATEKEIVEGDGFRVRGKATLKKTLWGDYLFSQRRISRGHWVYQIDYTGRGGSLNSYEIYYDRVLEKYKGTVTYLAPSW